MQIQQQKLPFKLKIRAGRHVQGQSCYEPFLDVNNWHRDSKDLKSGALSPFALKKALI